MTPCGALVIARLDSARLPGKVLRTSLGRPLIEIVCQRLLNAGLDPQAIVVATTDRPVDDPLALWASAFGVPVCRGAVDDVATRCLKCAEARGWHAFARVNADSPLIAADLVYKALQAVTSGRADFITNLVPRSFPYGVSVEVIGTQTYRNSLAGIAPSEREHVTQHLYRQPPALTENWTCPAGDLSAVRLVVDTLDDEQNLAGLLQRSGQEPLTADPISLALIAQTD